MWRARSTPTSMLSVKINSGLGHVSSDELAFELEDVVFVVVDDDEDGL
jgi:hypothetical protein